LKFWPNLERALLLLILREIRTGSQKNDGPTGDSLRNSGSKKFQRKNLPWMFFEAMEPKNGIVVSSFWFNDGAFFTRLPYERKRHGLVPSFSASLKVIARGSVQSV
jgi:hypothetical protein